MYDSIDRVVDSYLFCKVPSTFMDYLYCNKYIVLIILAFIAIILAFIYLTSDNLKN